MVTGNPRTGDASDVYADVFIDARADDARRAALQTVSGGQAGGRPAQLVQVLGPETRGTESAPIDVSIDDDQGTWRMRIPEKAEAVVEELTAPTARTGERVRFHNLPGAESPGTPDTVRRCDSRDGIRGVNR